MKGVLYRLKRLLGRNEEPHIFGGFTDCHTHLLPGVDDGVGSMEETLSILAEYERLGFRKIWLTPHIMEDIPNETSRLTEIFNDLKRAYTGNIDLSLASENMIDELFDERLRSNDLLPMECEHRYLLVETSFYDRPNNFLRQLEEVFSKGYTPLLAHPERYSYMSESDYIVLKKMGVHFQLNILAFARYYGTSVYAKAMWLASRNYYNVAGTDTHHERHAAEITRLSRNSRLSQILPLHY